MYLIAGLGNPGGKYQHHRHNTGFLFLDYLFQKYDFYEFKKRSNYTFAKGRIGLQELLLLKPQTFMNLSGEAIRLGLHFFKIKLENLIVVYDDIALPFGKIRIREKGSSGGHNGLKNIEKELGTQQYHRIRIGVDAPTVEGTLADFVLTDFNKEQLQRLQEEIFPDADQAIQFMMKGDIAAAMNQYNGKNRE